MISTTHGLQGSKDPQMRQTFQGLGDYFPEVRAKLKPLTRQREILYGTLAQIIFVPKLYFLAFPKYSISVSYSQVMPLLLLASV